MKEYSVSELSGELKRTIEDNFSYVRVRGELGRVTLAGSGHMYMDLKDDRAVISAVIWKGNASKLKIRPEQGMEMVATGRLTTFPGQSRYQIIIDTLEPAGVGALMALLEERKKKLTAEGLFEAARKKPLPFLPDVIGVVTSPSGAVIRDILHRLRARFPRHVLVWPSLVQGEQAAKQIVAGIKGFNALPKNGSVPRPDVLIVARGGGSLEDLWCFNEESVVRAVSESDIPLISAVGHETDTTLIDYVSDKRAPTPTAAAEIAVPVRADLLAELENKARRLNSLQARLMEGREAMLISAGRGLGQPEAILDVPSQRLDQVVARLAHSLRMVVTQAAGRLAQAGTARPAVLAQGLARQETALRELSRRMTASQQRFLERREASLMMPGKLLESLSYKNILDRGFALVNDPDGRVVRQAASIEMGQAAIVRFGDGARQVVFGALAEANSRAEMVSRSDRHKKTAGKKPAVSKSKTKKPVISADQKSLFD